MSSDVKSYVTSKEAGGWRYEPAPKGKAVDLLTIGGLSIRASGREVFGSDYMAWAPFRVRDKALEARLFPNLVTWNLKGHESQFKE